jgi:protein kinase C substrate 80K-H
MAVLEAVRAYEKFAELPHINDVRKGEDSTEVKKEEGETSLADAGDEGLWSKDEISQKLDGLLRTDYDGLLLEHDKFAGTPSAEALRECAIPRRPCALELT